MCLSVFLCHTVSLIQSVLCSGPGLFWWVERLEKDKGLVWPTLVSGTKPGARSRVCQAERKWTWNERKLFLSHLWCFLILSHQKHFWTDGDGAETSVVLLSLNFYLVDKWICFLKKVRTFWLYMCRTACFPTWPCCLWAFLGWTVFAPDVPHPPTNPSTSRSTSIISSSAPTFGLSWLAWFCL